MQRDHKKKSVIAFPEDYIVIDTETTGLDFKYCDLIEIAAIKFSAGVRVDEFSTLVKPPIDYWFDEDDDDDEDHEVDEDGEDEDDGIPHYVNSFITKLTGITNEMLDNAPPAGEVIPKFIEFIGDSTLIGHNVNFDINFLYDAVELHTDVHLSNEFIDTMRIARKVFPESTRHRLKDVAKECGVDYESAHRALADCEITASCFSFMRSETLSKMTESDFIALFKIKRKVQGYDKFIESIDANDSMTDESNPMYGKVVVFTGALQHMPRKQALQIVANIGGVPADNMTKETSFLVVGDGEFTKSVKDGKTSKMKKAESLALNGREIRVISETSFFDLVEHK